MNQNKDIEKKIIKTASKTILNHNMISSNDSILIGVSGGPDSVGLLLFLLKKKYEYLITLGIAHINHSLRGKESDKDARFVKTLAAKHNLPFFLKKKNVGDFAKKNHMSIEDAARKIRYSFYKKICEKKKYSKIALGHNKDDNAELVLMNLLRGSGAKGLSGIPPKRNSWIIRPFIEITKQNILEYLKFQNQKYVIDTSNTNKKFLRNRIRNHIFPILKNKYNPAIIESLTRTAQIIREENQWMEKQTEICFNQALKKKKHNEVQLYRKFFINLKTALKRRLARKAIKEIKGNLKCITLFHIDSIIKLASSITSGKSLDFPDQIRVIKTKKELYFKKEFRSLRNIGKIKI
ncbi:MAG: tRNA lysidine(34) synthetase TilS [Desulfobacteraceae bacterium 4572_130]|nr:MAG: tRNA lysidine(34) synthetase TilS [Desulfobacteraceae bacterium 4572_130]